MAEILGVPEDPFPCVPLVATLTRNVLPVWRSRTKTSLWPFVSCRTRFVACDRKTTNRPFAEMAVSLLEAFAWAPAELTLTRFVGAVPVAAPGASATAVTTERETAKPLTTC